MRVGYWTFKVWNMVRLARPHFLLASVLLFLSGALFQTSLEDITTPTVLTLVAVVLVQLSAHYLNEYSDWEGDRFSRRSLFSGGSGVLATGWSSPRTALLLGIGSGTLALALGAYVGWTTEGREWTMPLLFLGLVLAWCYSLPPVRLINSGWGELVVAVMLAFQVPLIGHYLAKGELDLDFLPYSLVLFPFCYSAIVGVQFPDKQADIRSRKRNLTYRVGVGKAFLLTMISSIIALGLTLALYLQGSVTWPLLLSFLTLPALAWARSSMERTEQYDHALAVLVTYVHMGSLVLVMVLTLLCQLV